MKICALATLLVFCIVQNTSATSPDWQTNVKLNGWLNVVFYIDRTYVKILDMVKAKPSASACKESARATAQDLMYAAREEIWRCADASVDEAQGNACTQAEFERTSARAEEILKEAIACIEK